MRCGFKITLIKRKFSSRVYYLSGSEGYFIQFGYVLLLSLAKIVFLDLTKNEKDEYIQNLLASFYLFLNGLS